MSTPWFVYLLRCADGTLYAGVTTDVTRRVDEHNHSDKLGARYTRARRPVQLFHSEPAASRAEACRREAAIRKLSRADKLALAHNTGFPRPQGEGQGEGI
jgi:putative endonuclease